MSVVLVRRWTRALTFAAALFVGLATAAIPAAIPAEAGGQPDLEMHATGEGTFNIHTSVLVHRMIVDVHGATVAPGQVSVTATFPNGVRPTGRIQTTNTHTTWNCAATTSGVICKNTSPFVPNTGGVYIQVDLAVSAPTNATVVSKVDPFGAVPESNEANNAGVFTYHFVQ